MLWQGQYLDKAAGVALWVAKSFRQDLTAWAVVRTTLKPFLSCDIDASLVDSHLYLEIVKKRYFAALPDMFFDLSFVRARQVVSEGCHLTASYQRTQPNRSADKNVTAENIMRLVATGKLPLSVHHLALAEVTVSAHHNQAPTSLSDLRSALISADLNRFCALRRPRGGKQVEYLIVDGSGFGDNKENKDRYKVAIETLTPLLDEKLQPHRVPTPGGGSSVSAA